MFSSIGTKLALKKAGLPTDLLNFSGPSTTLGFPGGSSSAGPNKLRKNPPPAGVHADADAESGWGSWVSIKTLPLSVQPWLSPPPPPVAVARRVPGIGDKAPEDCHRRLVCGRGQRILLIFLRCAGCAFAQKTFLNLRTLANRYSDLTCIAVSHASEQATRKWIDLLGGAWLVRVIVDEDRTLYAAWGLGVGSTWYLLNPTTQIQGWREKGWLGDKVAGAIQRTGGPATSAAAGASGDEDAASVMGNKWQEVGAFAIDGTGTVIWGGKALRADDVMDLDDGARILRA